MVQRLTYRKRHSYATKSNQHRVVKTPGNRLIIFISMIRSIVCFKRVLMSFCYYQQVGSLFIKLQKREQVDRNAPLLVNESKG